MRRAPSLLVLFLATTSAMAQEPIDVDPWSLVRLDVEIRVSTEPPSLSMRGKAVVRLEAETSHGPSFGLNSRKRVMSLQRLTGRGAAATVRPLREGSPIEVAALRLPRTFRRGETLEVEFEAFSLEQSSQFVWSADRAYASWVEIWYPVPAKSASELSSSAAPGTTTLRIPEKWRSVSNGTLVSRTVRGGEATEVWSSESPASRSFVAAPFSTVEVVRSGTREIGTYLLTPRLHIREQTEVLAKAIEAMERRFGPYPYRTYNIVEVGESPSFAASSEQGFIMVKSSLLDAPAGNLPLFAHEAAHGWWGNLVRTDGPGSRMLSEALAQYGAVISIETIEGEAAAARFLRYSREGYNPLQCALGYFHIWREGGDRPLSQLAAARWGHTLADSKGMWFYRMLRDRMGDDRFFAALRTIIRDYGGRQASLDDLRAVVLRVSDDAELPLFLEQWLDREGAPVPRVEWWSVDRGRGVEVRIEQWQTGEPYQMPIVIAVDTEAGTTVRTKVMLCDRKQSIFIATPSRPVGVRLDPDDRVLIWRPEYGPPPV